MLAAIGFSVAFNLAAYLGLRWPAIRSVFTRERLDDHLSWSGAVLGALVGLVPVAVAGLSSPPPTFIMQALFLMFAYYALGKLTCTYIGCCDYRHLALRAKLRIPLPLLEAVAVTAVAVIMLSLRTARANNELAAGLIGFGAIRILSRLLRSESLRVVAQSTLRVDSLPCLLLGLALLVAPQLYR